MPEHIANHPTLTAPAHVAPTSISGHLTGWVKGVFLFAPYAVLCGNSYRQGFAQGLRIPESLLSWPPEQYALKGCTALLKALSIWIGPDAAALMKWLAAMTTLALFYLLGSYLFGNGVIAFRAWCAKRWGHTIRNWLRQKPRSSAGHALGFLIAGAAPFFIILILLYVFLPPFVVEQEGRRDAETIRRELNDPAKAKMYASVLLAPVESLSKANNDRETSPPSNQNLGPIPLIECDGDWCVVYDRHEFGVVPKTNVRSITAAAPPRS